jgi:hypothetical protein
MTFQELNIREWVQEGKGRGASHLIIIRDDYYDCESPIFIFPEQDIQEEIIKAMQSGWVVGVTILGENSTNLLTGPILVSRVEH